MLVDDALSPGNLAFTSVAILPYDLAQAIRNVNVDVVELPNAWVNIPGYTQVHQEQRAISARRHRPLDDIAAQNWFISGDRRHDHIRRWQRCLPLPPPDDLPAELPCRLLRPRPRA